MAIIMANGNGVSIGANGGFDYVKDGDIYMGVEAREVMIESSSELSLLGDYPPGSMAALTDYSKAWRLSAAGVWKPIGGEVE